MLSHIVAQLAIPIFYCTLDQNSNVLKNNKSSILKTVISIEIIYGELTMALHLQGPQVLGIRLGEL